MAICYVYLRQAPTIFQRISQHIFSVHTLTHSQNEYSEIRNPNVNHNTQNCETNLGCSEPCVCAVRTLTQFCVLCWIIHFINPQSTVYTHTLLMSAWIQNRSPYHMWKPLYGNEKSLIEIVMRVTRVCVRARLPCERQRSFQPATISNGTDAQSVPCHSQLRMKMPRPFDE